jgi:hypothetical protein
MNIFIITGIFNKLRNMNTISSVRFLKYDIAIIKFCDMVTGVEICEFGFECSKYIEAFKNLIDHLNGNTNKNTIHDKYDENGNHIWTIGDYNVSVNCEVDLILNSSNNIVKYIGEVTDFPNEIGRFNFSTVLNESTIDVFFKLAHYVPIGDDNNNNNNNDNDNDNDNNNDTDDINEINGIN